MGPHLVEPQRWRQNLHSDLGMANMQREESKHEKLEQEQREREQDAASDCCLQGTGDEVSAVQNNRPERQAQRATALATTEC